MLWRVSPGRSRRTPPVGFILPCQPVLVPKPPAGLGWLHEVKHDGYRIIPPRKEGYPRNCRAARSGKIAEGYPGRDAGKGLPGQP